MEKECNVVTLNGVEYTEINRLNNKNNTYVVLANLDDPSDFCIKKLITRDGLNYINGLDSEEEFKEILNLISKN